MTQASELGLKTSRFTDARIIGGVSAAHLVSHYYILLLPPLFMAVRAEYGVSFTELGLALSLFNIFSAALQTPAGFLVDRVSAPLVLIGGLVLGAAAFLVAGLVNSFWVLVAMFAVAGIGNAVYHPADYSILSHQVAPARIGQAFSVHTFAGMIGSTLAPATLVPLQGVIGWRGGFVTAAIFGFLVAALLAAQPEAFARSGPVTKTTATGKPGGGMEGWRLLLSGPIVRNLIFFVLFAVIMAGIQGYALVALGALHQTPLAIANAGVTGFLLLSAFGVLLGGVVVGRTSRHGLIATLGLLVMAAVATLVAMVDLPPVLLVAALSFGGFAIGIIMPSRDLLVRDVTPPGSFGKVFGFVTTGFNIGGIFAPLLFGALMDHGAPRTVFMVVAACCVVSIGILTLRSPGAAETKA
jgi:MFS family permease